MVESTKKHKKSKSKKGHKKNKKEGKKHSKTKNESTTVSFTQDMSSKSVEDTVHAQAIPRTTLTVKVTKTAEAPLPIQTADQHILIQPPKEFVPGNDLGNVVDPLLTFIGYAFLL
ncbi:hypothetical protein CU097_007829 [Rhizopus azygosporus]|uniref:Uncharacterized protein n=1 Tax=Rhizopus azygosporus TaxID=86630 RepID=A0A367J6D9_RHIAZ|nr:hypothetical protein CU097_007829 [Rhizopus azygosporus]